MYGLMNHICGLAFKWMRIGTYQTEQNSTQVGERFRVEKNGGGMAYGEVSGPPGRCVGKKNYYFNCIFLYGFIDQFIMLDSNYCEETFCRGHVQKQLNRNGSPIVQAINRVRPIAVERNDKRQTLSNK